jgi:beta-galactosidase
LHAHAQREVVSINEHWKFSINDIPEAFQANYQDQSWETVNLPHTWNNDAYTVRNYHRGVCWYRKSLTIPKSSQGKLLFLQFDAVNSSAEVYINGQWAGKHEGGYTAFTLNITDAVRYGENNILAVKADNRNKDIPPLSGDFTIFGGIYREVRLIAVEKQHFAMTDCGSNGVYVETPAVSDSTAKLAIRGQIFNDDNQAVQTLLKVTILDAQQKTAVQKELKLEIAANGEIPFDLNDIIIDNPLLWSPAQPHLYTVQLALIDLKTNIVKDRLQIHTGLRWFSATTQNGFMLNGKPLKLIGVNRHQDQAPLGIALPDEMHRRDMRMIKDMGANFVRLAHYPQDATVLDECDRLGLLVWEEIPIVDIIETTGQFAVNCKNMLKEMVRQHYNHPCVVMWGYMNEAIIQVPHKITAGRRHEYYSKTVALAKEMEQLLKTEDASRLSAMAFHGNTIYNETGLANITDVAGWNLYQGWYGEDLPGFERFIDNQHKLDSNRLLFISEFGAGSDRRLQSLHPEIFDFSIQWQQKFLEYYLPSIHNRTFIIGATEWNFADFSSASRQESMPRINNKGLVDNNRKPKDVYYYFQSFLRSDSNILHIATDDWPVRTVVSNTAKTIHPIKVYSNMPKLSLSVNGVYVGEKATDNFHAVWETPLSEGENIIRVTGYRGNTAKSQEKTIIIKTVPDKITAQNANGLELAINAGSNCFFTDEFSELCWLPDREYKAGGWGYIGGKVFRKTPGRVGTTAEIGGTHNTPLFQTMRENPDAYRFDVPNGMYEAEFLFADLYNAPKKEVYDLAKEQSHFVGHNVFEIIINGKPVTDGFSPFAEAGNNFAVKKKYLIDVTNGVIQIQLKSIDGNTFLNAIKIKRL